MILPVLAAAALQQILRWAIRRGLQEVIDMAQDAIIQRLMDQARQYAERMLLARAAQICPECDPEEYLRSLQYPCSILSNGNPDGPGNYRGGSYAGNRRNRPPGARPGSVDGHHVPAKANYPSWRRLSRRERDRMAEHWPSINMDQADHRRTLSHPSHRLSGVYNRVQQRVFREHGILGAFALDAASIRLAHPDGKYDQALLEAGAYAACVSMFPDKYELRRRR